MSYCVTDGDEPAKAPEAKKKKFRAAAAPWLRRMASSGT